MVNNSRRRHCCGVGGCKIGQSMVIISSNLVRYLQRFDFVIQFFYLTIVISKTVFSTTLPFCSMLAWLYKQAFLQTLYRFLVVIFEMSVTKLQFYIIFMKYDNNAHMTILFVSSNFPRLQRLRRISYLF